MLLAMISLNSYPIRGLNASGVTSIHVVQFKDLTKPDWWLGKAFATALAEPDEMGSELLRAHIPPGATALAGKHATVTHAFDATGAGEGYMSVTEGMHIKFVTHAAAILCDDGKTVDAVALARAGTRDYMYGFVPLWVCARPDSYIPAAKRATKRKDSSVTVRFEEDAALHRAMLATILSQDEQRSAASGATTKQESP